MRLIDADILREGLKNTFSMYDDDTLIGLCIGATPTVEAIPIEWIEDWIKNQMFLYQDIAEGTIEEMLEDWRKENE